MCVSACSFSVNISNSRHSQCFLYAINEHQRQVCRIAKIAFERPEFISHLSPMCVSDCNKLGTDFPEWLQTYRRRSYLTSPRCVSVTNKLGTDFPEWLQTYRRHSYLTSPRCVSVTNKLGTDFPEWLQTYRRRCLYFDDQSPSAPLLPRE